MSSNEGVARALRHRPYLALWIGTLISSFGDSLHRLALAVWVMKNGSGLAMGIVLACSLVPMVPFLLIGGALVDRLDRTRIMLVSDIVRGVVSASIALLLAMDSLEIWHLCVASVVFGTFNAFFAPAMQAVIPSIVPKEDLLSANSLRTITRQLVSIVGPILAAAIISMGSMAVVFAIDAATFIVSALAITPLLKLKLKVQRDDTEGSILDDIRFGVAYVRREPWLWISIIAFFFINFATAPLVIVVTYIVLEVNAWDAKALGIIEGVMAVGTLGSALWLGRRGRLGNRGKAIYTAVIVTGVATLILGLPLPLYAICAIMFIGGFAGIAVALYWTSLMQDRVPIDQLGRVYSIDNATAVVTAPLGLAVMGWALDVLDVTAVCTISGGMIIVTGVIALMHPRIREID